MDVSVGLVIPAYKPDAGKLSKYIRSIHDEFDEITIRVELDSPEESVRGQLQNLPATLHYVPHRRGKGAAITAGFENLHTDVLAFADADGATPPAAVKSVVDTVVTDTTDVAVGSRRHPDSTVHTHQTHTRRYMGDAFATFARTLLEVELYDYQCGMKAISSAAWSKIRSHLHEPGFAWDIELVAMAAAHNLRIAEIPINWYDMPGSTVDPIRTSLDLIRAVILTRHRANQLSGSRLHETVARIRGNSPTLLERK